MKNSNSKITLNPNVVFREVDGEGLLMEPTSRALHIINDSALSFWKIMKNEMIVETLIEAALEVYDVERGQLEADVSVFLDRMVELHLIKISVE